MTRIRDPEMTTHPAQDEYSCESGSQNTGSELTGCASLLLWDIDGPCHPATGAQARLQRPDLRGCHTSGMIFLERDLVRFSFADPMQDFSRHCIKGRDYPTVISPGQYKQLLGESAQVHLIPPSLLLD